MTKPLGILHAMVTVSPLPLGFAAGGCDIGFAAGVAAWSDMGYTPTIATIAAGIRMTAPHVPPDTFWRNELMCRMTGCARIFSLYAAKYAFCPSMSPAISWTK